MEQSAWSSEVFFSSPLEYFESLRLSLKQAEKSIEIETYIFDYDQVGREILQELKNAVQRGVTVRLLIDGFGTPDWSWQLSSFCEQNQIAFRVFNPLPWPFSRFYWKFLFQPNFFFSLLSTANRRDHRKIVLIDDNTALVGGINITASELTWEDGAVQVTGTETSLLKSSFEKNWTRSFHPRRLETKPAIKSQKLTPSRLVRIRQDLRSRRKSHRLWIKDLALAKSRVWLTTGYFIPPLSLVNALKHCAHKGLDVRLLLSQKSDLKPAPWISHFYFKNLLHAGVKIYLYRSGFIHAKYSVVDDRALVGSSNLNFRSRFRDQEADIVVQMPQTIKRIEEKYLRYLQDSELLSPQRYRKIHWLQILAGRVLLLLKRWL